MICIETRAMAHTTIAATTAAPAIAISSSRPNSESAPLPAACPAESVLEWGRVEVWARTGDGG